MPNVPSFIPIVSIMGAAMKAGGGALKKVKLKKKPKIKRKKLHVKAKKKGFNVPISKKNGKVKADFSNHLCQKKGIKNPVNIKPTGSRAADKAQLPKVKGYTWHHASYNHKTGDMKMELVNSRAHRTVGHAGGVLEYELATGIKYK